MFRPTKFALMALCAFTLASCSGTPQTMLSPTATEVADAALNPDGSNLKVSQPTGLTPAGGTVVNTLRPTLTFTGASGRFQAAALSHEVQIVNATDQTVYSADSASSPHAITLDLTYSDNFWWRARARMGAQFGPWSDWAQFRTLDRPTIVAPPSSSTGALPFPIPGPCLAPGDGDRFACAAAIANISVEWARCRSGSGVGCHRFTRQVGIALATADRNWTLIQAGPGGHSCNCNTCGPSDGSWFREDTLTYGGRNVYDMIVGAGGPSPSLNWTFVGGLRPGDFPVLPPACP